MVQYYTLRQGRHTRFELLFTIQHQPEMLLAFAVIYNISTLKYCTTIINYKLLNSKLKSLKFILTIQFLINTQNPARTAISKPNTTFRRINAPINNANIRMLNNASTRNFIIYVLKSFYTFFIKFIN